MKKRLGSPALLSILPFVLPVLVLAASTLPGGRALADDASEAKTHYQKATAHYAVGEYKEAAQEYEAAYKAKQDPALLYNAAQSHRLAGENQKALLLYKNIVKLYPTSKYAAESRDRIDKLEQAIAATNSPPNEPALVGVGTTAPAAPVPPAPSGAPPPPATAPVQPLAPAAPAVTAVPAAPPPAGTSAPAATVASTAPVPGGEAPIYEKWWFWTIVGAVVVGGVVAVALASGSTTPWNNVSNVNGSVR
jgi:hypothetical protein